MTNTLIVIYHIVNVLHMFSVVQMQPAMHNIPEFLVDSQPMITVKQNSSNTLYPWLGPVGAEVDCTTQKAAMYRNTGRSNDWVLSGNFECDRICEFGLV